LNHQASLASKIPCIRNTQALATAAVNPPFPSLGEFANYTELKACVCGFAFVAMGTMIWAYGDLLGCLLPWSSSCPI